MKRVQMIPEEKAHSMYLNAKIQHGIDNAKKEALITAKTVRDVVSSNLREYWCQVIEHLRAKN